MLHILWVLIKWILILLGILLGLVFLVILLILFCPVRYRISAVKEECCLKYTEAKMRISWLFGGVSFSLDRKSGDNFRELRILGIPVLSLLKKHRAKKASDSRRKSENRVNRNQDFSEGKEIQSEKIPGTDKDYSFPDRDINIEEELVLKKEYSEKELNKITEIWEKLKKVLNKLKDIPSVFSSILSTLKNICDKMEWWKNFFEHPRIKSGIEFARMEAWKLLKQIFPVKINGYVKFGSEDPSVTGTVLAVLGVTMPLHKNKIEIIPVFENQNFLEGNIKMKGRVYCCVPIKILLELYFNKDIKYIFHRWKNKEV